MRVAWLLTLLFTASLPAQATLCTIFQSNGGGSSTWGNIFDVDVLNPGGVRVTSLDVNSTAAAGTALTIDVWVTATSYVGKDADASLWRMVATGAGTTAGRDAATTVNISDFYLPSGSYGIAIYYYGAGPAYTNGNGSNQSYANVDLALTLGVSRSALFSGAGFNPRVWNGCITYDPAPTAVFGFMGEGCPGSAGTPSLTPAMGSVPRIGQPHTIALGNLPPQSPVAFVLIGLSNTAWSAGPLPADLGGFGMPGCFGRVRPDWTFALGAGTGTLSITYPNNGSLIGQTFFHQALVADPQAANPARAIMSDATGGVIGP